MGLYPGYRQYSHTHTHIIYIYIYVYNVESHLRTCVVRLHRKCYWSRYSRREAQFLWQKLAFQVDYLTFVVSHTSLAKRKHKKIYKQILGNFTHFHILYTCTTGVKGVELGRKKQPQSVKVSVGDKE